MPQAHLDARALQRVETRDWRAHFSARLSGRGLEIGPLHRPLATHPGMQMDYIDRLTVADLRGHYPELANLPLVESTIIGDAETFAGVADESYDFVEIGRASCRERV